MRVLRLLLVFLLVSSGGWAVPSPGSDSKIFPPGSVGFEVAFDSWFVGCSKRSGGKVCTMWQHQYEQRTSKRVLSVEIKKFTKNGVDFVLVLPFGLIFDSGVEVRVDGERFVGKRLSGKLSFKTCLPSGCVVDLHLDARQLGALYRGAVLEVKAVGSEGSIPLSIPLKGFESAYKYLESVSSSK